MIEFMMGCVFLLSRVAHAQNSVFQDMNDVELTAPALITSQNLGEHVVDAQEIYAMSLLDLKKIPLYVKFDITRGGSVAKVYKFGKLEREYPIRGGLNQLVKNGRGQPSCAFTSTGRFQPTALDKNKMSGENGNAPMPFYVELDAARGLGGHQGNLNGHSHACVRQSRSHAEALYKDVASVSEVASNGKVLKTGAVFEIIDNTPGIHQAKQDCIKRCRATGRCVTPHMSDVEIPLRPFSLDNFTKTMPEFLHRHMQFRTDGGIPEYPAYMNTSPPAVQ